MEIFIGILFKFIELYKILLLLSVLFSWIDPYRKMKIANIVRLFTDPLLNLFRIIIPIGNLRLDISPIIAFYLIDLVANLILRISLF